MKNLLCCTICLLTGFCAMTARNLSGRIITADSGQPLAFANVVTLSVTDSSLIAGSVSDENGLFKIMIPDDEKKEMFLRVTYVGYNNVEKRLDAFAALGDIAMTPSSNELGEVTVTAPKPSTKLTGTGLITNVANTTLSSIGSAKDLLRFIPLLVNVGDNWTVLTKGTPIFYINGRKMRNKNELETLRSTDIVSVEVITDPGAQYPPETSAIVKIKTRRPHGEGLSGMLSANGGHADNALFIGNANLNFRHKQLDIFVNSHYDIFPRRQEISSLSNLLTDPAVELSQYTKNNIKKRGLYVNTGASYTINENSSFGASYSISGNLKREATSTGWQDVTIAGINDENIITENFSKEKFSPYQTVNAYYIGRIGKTTVNLDANYINYDQKSNQIIKETSQTLASEVTSTDKNITDMVSAKLTIENTLWGGKVEYGAEYVFADSRSTYQETNAGTTDYNSRMVEYNLSPYIEYSRRFPFGYIIAGLRYGHTGQTEYRNGIKRDSRSYYNLYPALTWSKEFGQVQMQLNYRSYSNHAPLSEYSDEIHYVNRFQRNAGNPFLKESDIHTLSLMGMWKFLIIGARYINFKGSLVEQSYIEPDNPLVEIMKTVNATERDQTLSASVTAQPQFGCYSPSLTFSFSKPWYSMQQDDQRHSFGKPAFGIYFFNSINLPKDWMIILQMQYQSKGDEAASRMLRDSFDVTGVIYKWLFNRRLQLSLIANDIFHTSKRGILTYYGASTRTTWITSDSRSVWLGATYTFNATNSKYRGNTSKGKNENLIKGSM